jgi:dihydroflavonol-4-reductase
VVTTRVVLEECLRAEVERVVHTSSTAAIGPAPKGGTADERTLWRGGLGIPYADAKHEAEVEALRIAARGLPVVVVCPAYVLGRGDLGRSSTELVRRFMLRRIPAYVEGAINVVDVEDVAAGMLLADSAGLPGERYILGNRNYTWDRLFADLARLSGVEPPAVRLSRTAALALAETLVRAPGPTPITPVEVRSAAHWWTYRSSKARRELGWTTRPHEETVDATVAWYREREGGRLARIGTRQPLGWRAAGFAVRRIGELVP